MPSRVRAWQGTNVHYKSIHSYLSGLLLSCLFSLNGLSPPLSRRGFSGQLIPSATSNLRMSANSRPLIAPFLQYPLTKLGLVSCWIFSTTSEIFRWAMAVCLIWKIQLPRVYVYVHTLHYIFTKRPAVYKRAPHIHMHFTFMISLVLNGIVCCS